MKKVYKKLTEDQKARGVIFSSQLVKDHEEEEDATRHEVKADQKDKDTVIYRLLEDSFFNNSPYKYNLIRR